jgi:eukaryotic-like serine/threonine-protein kinase
MTSPGRPEHVATRIPAAPHARVWLVAVVAAAYVGYVGLLLACDLLRVAPIGFVGRFGPSGMTAGELQAGSAAARAGLLTGDHITHANGQVLARGSDWRRVRLHLDPSVPLDLAVERAGRTSTLHVPLTAGLRESLYGTPRPALLTFRGAQVITLALAIIVAFRRAGQPSALLGAWLMGVMSTISIVLPDRLAAFWRALPVMVQALLWVPYAASVVVGPLLFGFFAVFPQRTWPRARLALVLLPAIPVVVWHALAGYQLLQPPGAPIGISDPLPALFVVNMTYAGAAVLLLAHRRAAQTLTDQRRIRVLMLGTIIGGTAGGAAVLGYLRSGGADVFATRTVAVLALAFLAVPASFAYAILRHRLFDLSLIVRQGVRYALARRFMNALIPALGALLVGDLMLHRQEPLLAVVQARWWWYTLVLAALVLARSRRERWLKSLDRRFFRERYDAQRLIRNVAEQITRASSFQAIAPSIAQQLEEALHAAFVDVLTHVPDRMVFAPVAGGTPPPLPATFTVIELLSVLQKPLALRLGEPTWVGDQLPLDEREQLASRGIELLVPITSQATGRNPAALLALGQRRSEEPYNDEDLDLLATVAHALGLLLDRVPGEVASSGFAECERCGRCFDSAAQVCSQDRQPLAPLKGSRTLNGRYRLDRRLGRGGMGAVYAALDEALDRHVAVKVIRDDLSVSEDLNERFRREARAAAGLAHAHVVRVYDFGVDRDGRVFLVMELLEGETLRQRLGAGQPLSGPEALHVLRGVCTGVSAAHRMGLVHRDLKPENIFLEWHESGVVPKVLDFGLAKAFGTRWTVERTHGTSAGLLVGTLDYMAPEQAAGDLVNPGWDTWALTVIAYEMLTLRHPFRRSVAFGAEGMETDALVSAAEPAPRALPDATAAFFQRALSSERTVRPPDALALLHDLEAAIA